MNFLLNSLKLGGDSKYHLEDSVEGLEKPDIRSGSSNFSGQDGGYVSTQFYGMRVIVIKGFYIGKTCDEADELRKALSNSLPIRELLPLFITTDSGDKYLAEGYLFDLKNPYSGQRAGRFQITVTCPDSYLYDAGDGVDPNSGFISAPFYKLKPGGYVTPYVLPVQWVAGTQSTPITNNGEIDVKPQIILGGQFTNPVVRNLTTGKFIKLGITTTSTDTIIIDMKTRTITLNGGSIAASRTLDSSWWVLEQGLNRILLESDLSGDNTFGTIRWRVGYEGT